MIDHRQLVDEVYERHMESFRFYLTVVSVRVEKSDGGWDLLGRLNAPGRQERRILTEKTRMEAREAAKNWRKWRKQLR